jgi:hypothetical protein
MLFNALQVTITSFFRSVFGSVFISISHFDFHARAEFRIGGVVQFGCLGSGPHDFVMTGPLASSPATGINDHPC